MKHVQATSTNTTKPVIWWQNLLINAWSPGKLITWEEGLLVSPQGEGQNLSGFQLVESNWAETTSDSRQPHHGYVCPGNYHSKYTPGFGRSKRIILIGHILP